MATPTSSLQTLANDEAIAFVASLQKVKDHLSQELRWVREQVQQKTVQLQGIDTLLLEASALGLLTAAQSMSEDALVVAAPAALIPTSITTQENALELSATEKRSTSPVTATEPAATAIAALPIKKPSKHQSGQQEKAGQVTLPRRSNPSTSTKTSTAKAKQSKPSTLSGSKTNPRGKASNLQQFLQSQWRDKALTEAVVDILNRASTPLSTDEVMAALYDGMPKEHYERAKHSLANTLSVGRSKGTWQSTGRGRYAGNTVITT